MSGVRRGWAEWYVSRGWVPIPLHPVRDEPGAPVDEFKRPEINGHTSMRLDGAGGLTHGGAVFGLDRFDGEGNIGVLTGAASGGLADVDLDDPRGDVQALAPVFLPESMTFGHSLKPRSHWLYQCEPAKREAWTVPRLDSGGAPVLTADGKRTTDTLLELRSEGGYTMFPGSVHREGGPVDWSEGLDLATAVPLDVDRADLEERCRRLAVAALLTREGMDRTDAADVAREAPGEALRGRLRFEPHRAAVAKWFGLAGAPVEAPRAPSRAPDLTGSNERPGDWLARNVSWADILTPHGWTASAPVNGQESWRRPGSRKGAGERSAYVSGDGGRLFVKSTNAAPLEADADYDKIGALARLEGVTVGEAARLVRERFGMPTSTRTRPDAADTALKGWVDSHRAPPVEAPAGAPVPATSGAPDKASTKSTAAPAPAVHADLLKGPGELPELAPHLRPPQRPMLLTRPYAPGERPEFEGAGEPGFLPRGIVAMLAGEGGGGKTQAAVQLGVAVATAGFGASRESDAGRWLGTYTVTERGRVALALGEEDGDEIHRRVWNTLRALEEREDAAHDDYFGPGPKRTARAVWKYAAAVRENVRPWALAGVSAVFIVPVDAVPRGGGPQPCDPTAAFLAFEAALQRDGKPWALIVVDPATRFLGADSETNNKAATEWMNLVHRLTKLPGNPTVLVIHHTNKAARKEGLADASASRGSSALTDGARWVATLAAPHRDDDSTVCDLRLALVKANYVRAGLPPLELIRDGEHANYLRPMTDRERTARASERDLEAIEREATKKGRAKAVGELAEKKSGEIKASLTGAPVEASTGGAGPSKGSKSVTRGRRGMDDDEITPL